jgi:hypothetical protein
MLPARSYPGREVQQSTRFHFVLDKAQGRRHERVRYDSHLQLIDGKDTGHTPGARMSSDGEQTSQ